jgi:hypothetical protein
LTIIRVSFPLGPQDLERHPSGHALCCQSIAAYTKIVM